MTVMPSAVPVAPTASETASRTPRHATTAFRILLGAAAAAAAGVVLGLGLGLYLLLGVLAVAFAMLVFCTERGLLYILVLVPFVESVTIGPLTVGRVMATVTALVLLIRLAGGRLRVPSFPPVTWLPAAGLVLVVVASGLWASDFGAWTFALGQMALALAFFVAYALLVTDPDQIPGLLRAYVLGAIFAAAVGFAQSAQALRAEGLQGDPNIYGLYQVAAVPAAIGLIALSSGWHRWIWVAALVPILTSVITSQSRGALLALLATALYLAVTHRRRAILVPLIAAVGIALTTIAPMIDTRYAAERVADDRASGRIDIWHTAWAAFIDQPWTGIGAGNFVPQSIERLTTEPGVELVKSHLLTGTGIEVHNIYLESLAERGVFGLLTLLVFLLATLGCLILAYRRFRSPAVAALAPMLVAFSVGAFFLSVINSKLLWMLAGLAAALLTLPASARPPVSSSPAATRSFP